MVPDQHVINKVDVPAVWIAVFLDKFFLLPWPGVAAFLASLYTFVRLVGMARKWWKSR